jgi:hypothetical protein
MRRLALTIPVGTFLRPTKSADQNRAPPAKPPPGQVPSIAPESPRAGSAPNTALATARFDLRCQCLVNNVYRYHF